MLAGWLGVEAWLGGGPGPSGVGGSPGKVKSGGRVETEVCGERLCIGSRP